MTASDATASASRLAAVRSRIADAARAAGRAPQEVTLVAVSKTFDANAIVPLIEAGQRIFGENRVQEAAAKWPALKERYADIELHLIGPLQTNKLDDALKLFDVFHTLDRAKLAAALVKARDKGAALPRLLVQVNTGDEPPNSCTCRQRAVRRARLGRTDPHHCLWRAARQDFQHVGKPQRDATFRRLQDAVFLVGEMKEYRTAGAGPWRIVIVTEHDDEIVEMVVAPHRLGAGRIRQTNQPVVCRVPRRVAPAVPACRRISRQAGACSRSARYRSCLSGKMPMGVPPSPSCLSFTSPARPSAQTNSSSATVSRPRVSPGSAVTRISLEVAMAASI